MEIKSYFFRKKVPGILNQDFISGDILSKDFRKLDFLKFKV